MKRSTPIKELPKRSWLLSDEDFVDVCGENTDTLDWMLNLMWNNGITSPEDAKMKFEQTRFEYGNPDCPNCGIIDSHYHLSSNQWKCKNCLAKFSLTSGTYIDNTKLEFYHWWRFCYLIGELKITNSCVIAKDLDITQLSAWRMIDTLRTARKENTKRKFVNGQEILVFNNLWEVLELLIKRKNKIKAERKLATKVKTSEQIQNLALNENKEKIIIDTSDANLKKAWVEYKANPKKMPLKLIEGYINYELTKLNKKS